MMIRIKTTLLISTSNNTEVCAMMHKLLLLFLNIDNVKNAITITEFNYVCYLCYLYTLYIFCTVKFY
jgi:hypothetical protein